MLTDCDSHILQKYFTKHTKRYSSWPEMPNLLSDAFTVCVRRDWYGNEDLLLGSRHKLITYRADRRYMPLTGVCVNINQRCLHKRIRVLSFIEKN